MQMPESAWLTFAIVFGILLTVDLTVHRAGRQETHRRALLWTMIWIAAGLAFWAYVWVIGGARNAHEYIAVYVIEKSLSLDNLFVFLLVFRSLKIPERHQRTALSWGILGALIFRALLIFAGVRAVERWSWLEYLFGAFLFYAAWHAFREDPISRKENWVIRRLSQRLPVSRETNTSSFLVNENHQRKATPVFVAVLAIEISDFIFAVDSVTVALSVTRNEFLIYSANAFAILGLRALYMFLAATIARMRYLHYGLGAILAFAGFKMVLKDVLEIPPLLSVAIIMTFMGISVWLSMRPESPHQREAREGHG